MASAQDIKKANRDELEKLAPEYGVDPEGKNVNELRSAILEQVEAGGESDDAPEDTDTTGDESAGDSAEGEDAPEEGEGDDADQPDESDDEEEEPAGEGRDLSEPLTPVVPNAAELAADQANAPAKDVARQKAIKKEEGPSGHPSSFDENGQPVFGSAKRSKEEGK